VGSNVRIGVGLMWKGVSSGAGAFLGHDWCAVWYYIVVNSSKRAPSCSFAFCKACRVEKDGL
jgi:hypothetical protein